MSGADLGRLDDFARAALAAGALHPIETEQVRISDAGLPFLVKWVSTLAAKPRAHKPARGGAHNPFLPPEPALTLGALPPDHLAVLNKYPVMARHLLIVTRRFEAQTEPITAGDFEALAPLIRLRGGLGFYNGGEIAGASQEHKHLQWIPESPPLAVMLPQVLAAPEDRLGFAHAFAPLETGLWEAPDCGARLAKVYASLLARLSIDATRPPLPPYNLLLTRDWMWAVPRRAEHWEGMSINALGFAGSLFVKTPERFPALEAAGPLTALRAVALPVSTSNYHTTAVP